MTEADRDRKLPHRRGATEESFSPKGEPAGRLEPVVTLHGLSRVDFDDEGLVYQGRSGRARYIEWRRLEEVGLLQTADALDKTAIVLLDSSESGGCFVPGHVDGAAALWRRLTDLPGFSLDMSGLSEVRPRRIVCWQRQAMH